MLNQKHAVVHILVVWHSAMKKRKEILSDLNSSFQILKVFRGHWSKSKWLDNWIVFYAHSQHHQKYDVFRRILFGKMRECQKGDFEVVVFRDNNPVFEKRETSSGIRKVNTRVFDKKQMYRKWTGGGSKIHGSDDAWETNKDLTLMFGMNTADFCDFYRKDLENLKECNNEWVEDSFYRNCIGVDGYKDIQQFFYVLNNTIRYCVLRNHEPIPEYYTAEGHGDIDLLVENRNYIAYLTLAKPQFPQEFRVYHHIKIGNSIVPFDFRSVGDGYYDETWQESILETRVFTKNLFYVPNPENQFYSLLYHAYVQKMEVKPDYFPKLSNYGRIINVSIALDKETALKCLDEFMLSHKYEYTIPNDKSVIFNYDNLKYSDYVSHNGYCVCRNFARKDPIGFFESIVCKKNNSFEKKGTKWLVDNEYNFLSKLSDRSFPKILSYKTLNDDESSFEMTSLPGIPANEFFSKRLNFNKKNIQDFLKESLRIFSVLHKEKILHRDVKLDNFLISCSENRMNVYLIDFGWATDYNHYNSPTPEKLCPLYSSKDNKMDAFEFGNLLMSEWKYIPCCRKISQGMTSVKKIDDLDPEFYDRLIKEISHISIVDGAIIRMYSFAKWERLRMAVKRRTVLKIRNGNFLWNKLYFFVELGRSLLR